MRPLGASGGAGTGGALAGMIDRHRIGPHAAVVSATLVLCLASAGTAAAAPEGAWLQRQLPWGLLLLALWIPIAWVLTRPRVFDRVVGAATPGVLGAIRILVCGRLFFFVLGEGGLPSLAVVPDTLRRSMGVMDALLALPLGLDALAHSPDGLRLLRLGTLVLLLLATIGWRTRLVVPLGALGAFVVAGLLRTYSFFWHQDLVALYLAGVLSLTPCGDGWSVDRLLATARGRAVPPAGQRAAVYGWARYACWTVLSLVYVAAGLSKLRNGGMYWWNGTTIRRVFLTDSLNPMQFDWGLSLQLAYMPEVVFALLGFLAVWGEVGYGLALVWPASRRVLPVMMGLMHVGIVFLQNILFLDLILLQLLFVDFTRVGKWIGRRLGVPRTDTPEAGATPAGVVPAASRRAPLAVAALAAFMLTIWMHEVEFFPLTSLQMYSQPVWRSHDPLVFYRVLAVRESGEASRAAWDEVVGPYARNARFRAFLWDYSRNPAQAARLRTFMTTMGEAWNRSAPAGRRVTRMEAQTWRSPWDDPRAGRLVDRFAVDLPPPEPAFAAAGAPRPER